MSMQAWVPVKVFVVVKSDLYSKYKNGVPSKGIEQQLYAFALTHRSVTYDFIDVNGGIN